MSKEKNRTCRVTLYSVLKKSLKEKSLRKNSLTALNGRTLHGGVFVNEDKFLVSVVYIYAFPTFFYNLSYLNRLRRRQIFQTPSRPSNVKNVTVFYTILQSKFLIICIKGTVQT
jgi:hypothetical protein